MVENNHNDLLDILRHVDPSVLEYQEWVNVGMALKDSGFTAADWDNWSKDDPARYKPGECFFKWNSFSGHSTPVKSGTIVQLATEQGWTPVQKEGRELEWNSTIGGKDDKVIIDKGWVEGKEVVEPAEWNPVDQLVKYLETLFEASENVGYVTESWLNDKDTYSPTKGSWDRSAGQLIQELRQSDGDMGKVLGDYKPEAGAWIRFNPLDGKGCRNDNVTDYRFALVESDRMPIDQQNAILRELELPIACLVHSGKKSLHAIVRIDAATYEEYRKRVDYLYDVCKKNGLIVDVQNKNPSRLSRMPGIMRNGHKQYLVDTNIGKESFLAWQEWIESVNDDLPEPENMAELWENVPELAPPLIDGILRQGHKMLLAGPSKAGKSFSLIELAIAIAEGKKWLNWACAKGRVMYVNLELDRASCLHRIKDVYNALEWEPKNAQNLDIWNLRGKAVPMDKLAPKLIRRAAKKNYIAIIIDPIYKVITGDENSADQMANFCNQFDKVCNELGSAVIYCHHHSKGTQGNKRSMDRASGSGVFARDPDVLLDLIELEVKDTLQGQEENKATAEHCLKKLKESREDWAELASQDDQCSAVQMLDICKDNLSKVEWNQLLYEIDGVKKQVAQRSAWRIEGTLREFPKFDPVNLWFDYPIHFLDGAGSLQDAEADGAAPPWQKATEKRKEGAQKTRKDNQKLFEDAVQNSNFGEPPTVKTLADYLSKSERTIRDWMKKYGYFTDKNNGNTVAKGSETDEKEVE